VSEECVIVLYRLCECGVTEKGCAALASALRSNPSYLIELNMSGNKRGHPGVKLLYELKKDPHYTLEGLGQYCEYILILNIYVCDCVFVDGIMLRAGGWSLKVSLYWILGQTRPKTG